VGSPVEVFLSYAAEDEAPRRELRARLAPLERDGVVRVWDASATGAGHAWHEERAARLHAARIVVLLVSADYLASDDLHRDEMLPSLERRANGEALVLAVLVRACGWDPGRFPVDALLPRNGRPVASWPNRDEAWADVAAGLREAVERGWAWLRERFPTSRESEALVRTLGGHAGGVMCVAVTPDGRLAVSASKDKTLKVWDLDTGQVVRTLKGHAREVAHPATLPQACVE